jgi:hypothetical protein
VSKAGEAMKARIEARRHAARAALAETAHGKVLLSFRKLRAQRLEDTRRWLSTARVATTTERPESVDYWIRRVKVLELELNALAAELTKLDARIDAEAMKVWKEA